MKRDPVFFSMGMIWEMTSNLESRCCLFQYVQWMLRVPGFFCIRTGLKIWKSHYESRASYVSTSDPPKEYTPWRLQNTLRQSKKSFSYPAIEKWMNLYIIKGRCLNPQHWKLCSSIRHFIFQESLNGGFPLNSLLRGSFGYLGYVEVVTRVITSISGLNMSPNPRVINLHITSY